MANLYNYTSIPNFTYGDGALSEIKRLTLGFGTRYLVVTGSKTVQEKIEKAISESLDSSVDAFRKDRLPMGQKQPLMCSLPIPDMDQIHIDYKFLDYRGVQVTFANIERLAKEIREFEADVVVAVGGGKALDIVRAAAMAVDVYQRPKVVLCPTQIASNASSTSMSAIYNDEGTRMVGLWNLANPPEALIIDTEMIVNAPLNTLVAAIGDNLGNCLEMLHMIEYGKRMDTVDRQALASVQTVHDILFNYSKQAVGAMERREITKEFEWVVSACAYMPGPFQSLGTICLAHLLDEVLIGFEPVSKMLHGLVVGYCSLVELVYFKKFEELYKYVEFYHAIGVPCTLEELGIPDATYEQIYTMAAAFFNHPVGMLPIDFTAKDFADGVMDAQRLITQYLANK
jgi:glycerol dehydrogenase